MLLDELCQINFLSDDKIKELVKYRKLLPKKPFFLYVSLRPFSYNGVQNNSITSRISLFFVWEVMDMSRYGLSWVYQLRRSIILSYIPFRGHRFLGLLTSFLGLPSCYLCGLALCPDLRVWSPSSSRVAYVRPLWFLVSSLLHSANCSVIPSFLFMFYKCDITIYFASDNNNLPFTLASITINSTKNTLSISFDQSVILSWLQLLFCWFN